MIRLGGGTIKASKKDIRLASSAASSIVHSIFSFNSKYWKTIGLAAIFLLLVGTCVCSAAVVTVDDSGSADYTTIQAAVDGAISGDTIQVSPGTYNENINVNKQVSIISTDGASDTSVIAASGYDHVFNVTAAGVTINGFSISGAINVDMAGIYLSSNNNILINNEVSENWHGIYLDSSNDNEVNSNTGSNNIIVVSIFLLPATTTWALT
jgi:parallel beta-helix repeat protein